MFLKPLSHQSGVLTAFPQRLKKMQNAEVRAVQTPATLCNRLERHVAAFKPLSHQSGVLSAFPHCFKKLQNVELGARCANASNAVETLCNRLERHAL